MPLNIRACQGLVDVSRHNHPTRDSLMPRGLSGEARLDLLKPLRTQPSRPSETGPAVKRVVGSSPIASTFRV
jgi:hypothetical protein